MVRSLSLMRVKAAAGRTDDERLVVLRWCVAGLLAFVLAVVIVASIVLGGKPSGLLWLPWFLGVFIVVLGVNWWAVGRTPGRGTAVARLLLRAVFGVFVALLVSYTSLFWMYSDEIEKARGAVAAQQWGTDVDRLTKALAKMRTIAERRVERVDSDPEVRRINGLLIELRPRAAQVTDNSMCERNGACDLRGEVKALERQLESARTTALQRTSRLARERDGARSALPTIRTDLDALGPSRPEVRARCAGLRSFAQAQAFPVARATIGTFLLCFLTDLVVFFLVVKLVCGDKGGHVAFAKTIAGKTSATEEGPLPVVGPPAIPASEFLKGPGNGVTHDAS